MNVSSTTILAWLLPAGLVRIDDATTIAVVAIATIVWW